MYKEKPNKFLLSCFISFTVFFYSNGQNLNYEFDHYTTNEGLSFGYSSCIYQDSKGFVWIGTLGGLNRFDGLSFINYLSDSKDSTSISGNVVYAMVEDTLRNMWICTNENLNLFDQRKNVFSKKSFRVNGKEIYNKLSLTGCFIDSRGYLWVATFGAIFRFKLYDNRQIYTNIIDAEKYTLEEDDVTYSNGTLVYSFAEDPQHIIWVASYSNKLFYFDDKLNSFIPKPIEHPKAKIFSNQQKRIIIDKDGDFFVTLDFNGLLVWYRKEDKFVLYQSNGTDSGPNDNLLFGITEARNGLIWIGAREKGGVNIFNKKTGKFSYCSSNPSNYYSLSTNSLVSFYEDKAGNMWIGTGAGKGLEKYSPYKKKFQRYFCRPSDKESLSNNSTLCFAESKSGDIWIGTDGYGLNKLNRKTGKFKHYLHNPADRNSISSNAIISLCEDHEGILWIGTFNGGLGRMKDNKFRAYLPDPSNPFSISYQHIWYVFEDSKQNLWVATLNRGVDLFDRKTSRFYNYSPTEGNPNSLCNNGLIQIFEDSKHNLYFTTYYGVSVLNLNDYDFSKMPLDLKFKTLRHIDDKNSLSSNIIYCVAEDKDGIIWFGTQATGIDKFDPKTGKFTNYSTHNGLPGNSVSSILIDNNNLLWVATNRGLAKFNSKTEDVYVFDNKDGLLNKSLKGWALKTKDGEMFFGGSDGFNSFYPDSIRYNNNIPPVVITGLKLFNQPVKIGEVINKRVLLTNDISETAKIVFKHFEDFITFEFIALDYTVPEKNQYTYMMVGFDKKWINCGTKREASYTNLDPGKYTFKVKASNNDGIWNEEGTSIEIIVLPPWWKTIWFRLLALILFTFWVTYFITRIVKGMIHTSILDERNQLKTLINNMPDFIFIKDTKLRFLVLNDVTIKFMGEKNEKDIILKTDFDFYTKEIAQKNFEEEKNIINTGIPIINKEETLTKNNQTLILSTTKCAIINTKGETIGLIGILSDITDKKIAEQKIIRQSEDLLAYNEQLNETNTILEERQQQVEEQAEELSLQAENLKKANSILFEKQQLIQKQAEKLQETNEQLTLLNATKDRFFSIIAHDLRNPFNVLIGFSELLLINQKKITEDKIQNYLRLINISSKSGYYLLENLLQWSRTQTGRISFDPALYKLATIIEETYKVLSGEAQQKEITLETFTDRNIMILADENMIKTVFRNLVSNSIKFTPVKGRITIYAVEHESEVEITVADTGVGIPEENLKKLFRIDTAVSTLGTAKERGTGLGLLLCKEFIEKHNGKIWVESIEGKGSNFKFTIPLK